MFKERNEISINTIRLILLIVCLIAPIIIFILYKAPKKEDIITANKLDNVTSKFGSVLILNKGNDSYYYYEKIKNNINLIQTIEKDGLLHINYYYNNKLFTKIDGKFYYIHVEEGLIQQYIDSMNLYIDLNKHLDTNNYQYSYFKKKNRRNIIIIYEGKNDDSKNIGEFSIWTNLYFDKFTWDVENKQELQFEYRRKKDFPSFIRNYELGTNVKITIAKMINGEVVFDEFEIQKGSMFRVKYNDNITLYTDSEYTNVYGDGTGSVEPVSDNLTLYMISNS